MKSHNEFTFSLSFKDMYIVTQSVLIAKLVIMRLQLNPYFCYNFKLLFAESVLFCFYKLFLIHFLSFIPPKLFQNNNASVPKLFLITDSTFEEVFFRNDRYMKIYPKSSLLIFNFTKFDTQYWMSDLISNGFYKNQIQCLFLLHSW